MNEARVTDKKQSNWASIKIPLKTDNDFKAKLKKLATDIAQDKATYDKEVFSYQAIKTMCTQEKVKICKGCGGINCALWAGMKKAKNLPRFLGKCDGTPAKFNDLSKFANEFIPTQKNKKDVTTENTTTQKQNSKSDQLAK